MGCKFAKSFFRRLTQFGRAIRNGLLVRPSLRIIGTSHAGIEVDLLISGEHTTPDQAARFLHCGCGRFTSPRKWPQMVPAQQDAIVGKSNLGPCGPNKRGELFRSLSRVTAKLIYLARSRLDVQN